MNLILLRNIKDLKFISSSDLKNGLILPLTSEADYSCRKENMKTLKVSSLVPSANWERWQWDVHEKIQNNYNSVDNEIMRIHYAQAVRICHAFYQSFKLAELISGFEKFDKCFAVTGPPDPIMEGSLRDDTRDNQIEWTIMKVLEKTGVEIIPIKDDEYKIPWRKRSLIGRVLDEFAPIRWPSLLLGLLSLAQQCIFCSSPTGFFKNDIILVSGVEIAGIEGEIENIKRDKPIQIMLSSIGQEGYRVLSKTKFQIRHIALLRLLFRKKNSSYVSDLEREIRQSISKVVGDEAPRSNPEWFKMQCRELAEYHIFIKNVFVDPFLSWASRVRPERLFFTSPYNPVNRYIAIQAKKMNIKTICLPHGGWYRKVFPNNYDIFDEVVVWGNYMKSEILNARYPGIITVQPQRIVDQGNKTAVSMPSAGTSPRILLISVTNHVVKPIHFISIDNFQRAVIMMIDATTQMKTELYVKCHPRYDNYEYYSLLENEGKMKILSRDTSLDDALKRCDVALCFVNFTTAMIRAMEMEIPIILVDTSGYDELLPCVTPSKYCYIARSTKEIVTGLKKITNPEDRLFREELIGRQNTFIKDYFSREKD